MKAGHMLCVGCVEEFPEHERHGLYCHKCYLGMTAGVVWKNETGPAPKEEGMECVDCGVKCADVPICNDCNTKRHQRWTRTAERRALYREAYMAALGGVCADPNIEKEVLAVNFAQGVALETVRQWDAMMAELEEG